MTNKYNNGKIYMIESDQCEKCYIGSTIQTLSRRMTDHYRDYRRYLKGKRNRVTSFELLKFDDAKIYLVEKFPCNSKEELEARERHWIKESNCVNKRIPQRTQKEWTLDNKERVMERTKNYRNANKDRINQRYKNYYEANKDKIQEYKKIYNEDNKDKLQEYRKTYRETHRDVIKQKNHDYQVQRVICDCGIEVSRHSLSRHKTRSLHAKNMAKLTVKTT